MEGRSRKRAPSSKVSLLRYDPSSEDVTTHTGTGTVRRKRIMLGDLNFDIALVIFTHLGLSSATCLGLSCPKFYAYFKIFHPAPIPLQAFASGSSCDIAHAIRSWSGLDNSRHCMLKTVLQFLNNDVDDHEKKTALLDCYDDQRSSQKFRKIYQLPNPIMMGPEWYSAAFKIIERDFRYTEQRSESVFDWQYRLEDFRVFSRYKDHWNKVVLRLGLQKAGNLLYVLTLSRSATAGFVQAVLKEALGSWRANEII